MDPTQHRKLILKMAHEYRRRLSAAGARVIDLEEIVGELNLAWAISNSRFDAERGVPFTAYFVNGARTHMSNWIRDTQAKEIANVACSLNDTTTEDGDELGEIVEDQRQVPADVQVELDARRNFIFQRLSPQAATVLELLEEPPPLLYAQLDAMRARAEFARSRGIRPGPVPRSITLAMIFTALGLERTQRARVYRELYGVAGLMSERVTKR